MLGEPCEVSVVCSGCSALGMTSCSEAIGIGGFVVDCVKKNGQLCLIGHRIVIPDGVVISHPLCLSCDCRISLS